MILVSFELKFTSLDVESDNLKLISIFRYKERTKMKNVIKKYVINIYNKKHHKFQIDDWACMVIGQHVEQLVIGTNGSNSIRKYYTYYFYRNPDRKSALNS